MSLIAVVTDFGRADPYAAELELALLRHGPADLRVLAVTHEIAPGDVAAGRWVCARVWPQLPAGAVLLAVVDPGVGSERPALAARLGERFFVGPGNGLAGDLAGTDDLPVNRTQVVHLEQYHAAPGHALAATFAGRDLFAPAAARLAGGTPLAALGSPGTPADLGEWPAPSGACTVVWIDRFGNLITDLSRHTELARRLDRGATLAVGGHTVRGPVRSYAEAPPGELVWYWGSGDTLEIALDRASAAGRLAAQVGLVIRLPDP
jgi:S-adenosyl-L-methionine hydrolase (adenosine-forming)